MRRMRRRRNPEEDQLPYGEWIPTEAVMFNEDGTVSLETDGSTVAVMSEPMTNRGRMRRRVRNVLDSKEDYAADIEELLNSAEDRLSTHDFKELMEFVKAAAQMRLY